MNVNLPGFDLNQDGKVDEAESFLSYKAYVDSEKNNSGVENNNTQKEVKPSPKSQNQYTDEAGCLAATLVVLAVLAIIVLIVLI